MNTLILILGLLACGAAITLVVRALSVGRLRTSQTVGQIADYGYVSPAPAAHEPTRRPLSTIAGAVADRLGAALGDTGDQSKVKARLMAAAMYETSVVKFTGYRLLATIGAAALWLWVSTTSGMPLALVIGGAVLGAVMGWVAPMAVVRRRADDRLRQIEREMPDLMDLLVVTVEAGLSWASRSRSRCATCSSAARRRRCGRSCGRCYRARRWASRSARSCVTCHTRCGCSRRPTPRSEPRKHL